MGKIISQKQNPYPMKIIYSNWHEDTHGQVHTSCKHRPTDVLELICLEFVHVHILQNQQSSCFAT
jgi:hypothetical protein